MTEQEIFEWGHRAEVLIKSEEYIPLYEKIAMDIAKEILATPLNDRELRNQLYNTYNGMRDFGIRLNAMIVSKEMTIERNDAEDNTDIEESN